MTKIVEDANRELAELRVKTVQAEELASDPRGWTIPIPPGFGEAECLWIAYLDIRARMDYPDSLSAIRVGLTHICEAMESLKLRLRAARQEHADQRTFQLRMAVEKHQ